MAQLPSSSNRPQPGGSTSAGARRSLDQTEGLLSGPESPDKASNSPPTESFEADIRKITSMTTCSSQWTSPGMLYANTQYSSPKTLVLRLQRLSPKANLTRTISRARSPNSMISHGPSSKYMGQGTLMRSSIGQAVTL
jgi:hypothetical protein